VKAHCPATQSAAGAAVASSRRCFRTSPCTSSTPTSPRLGRRRGIPTSVSYPDAKAWPTTASFVTRTIGCSWWPGPKQTPRACARRRQRCFSRWGCAFPRRRRESSTSTRASTCWECTSSVTSSEAPSSTSCTPIRAEPPSQRSRPRYGTRRADRRPNPRHRAAQIQLCAAWVDELPPLWGCGQNLRLHLAFTWRRVWCWLCHK
jgi:hypothetical protein